MKKSKHEVGLSTPHSPIGLTLELGTLWEEVLERKGIGVRLLSNYPQTEVIADIAKEQRVMEERINEWQSVLTAVRGLVIACYNTRNIDWDRGIVNQISIANRLGLPVFSQVDPGEVWKPAPGEEVIKAADLTIIRSNVSLINERLAE